jgi:hypothetical protein
MIRAALLLLACQACASAFAQNSATFVCGGIGDADQKAIKAQAPQHHLMLTFALSSGAYLADVDVQIRDSKGATVLSTRCGGPIMLVDLPSAGTWNVTAQSNGQTRQKQITAGSGKPVQATFTWPAGTS